jgi:virginiamycin B lyase
MIRPRGWVMLARVLAGTVVMAACQGAPPPSAGNATTSTVRSPAAPTITAAVRLYPGAFPRFLKFSGDGMLWITLNDNAVARLDQAGRLTTYKIPHSNTNPDDIIAGPGGAMWFSGFMTIGRVDPSGKITLSDAPTVGLPRALAAGPGDSTLWFTNEAVPPRITRLSLPGTSDSVEIPAADGGLYMAGIALGPDDAMWFTQSPVGPDDPPNAIGRVTAEGRYTSWKLPRPRSDPHRIIAGPDGALWFTERSGRRIGRITTKGAISEYRLPVGEYPFDIVAGRDGAVWFTTDTSVGRITPAGDSKLWSVPGAKSLIGLAAAEDGSLWLADGEGDTVWHVIPPQTPS